MFKSNQIFFKFALFFFFYLAQGNANFMLADKLFCIVWNFLFWVVFCGFGVLWFFVFFFANAKWWCSITSTKGNRYSYVWKSYHFMFISCVLLWLITHTFSSYFQVITCFICIQMGRGKKIADHVLIRVNVNYFFQQGFQSSISIHFIILYPYYPWTLLFFDNQISQDILRTSEGIHHPYS